jgi:VWFA-related protein
MGTGRTLRLVGAVAVLATAITSFPGAQTQTPAGQPIFRSGVDLVTIDVTVVDGEGRQVTDLDARAFEVDVDGQSRSVFSATFLGGTSSTTGAAVAGIAASDASQRQAQASAPPNKLVLAVDVAATSLDRRTEILAAANSILDRLSPADQVAVVASPLRVATVGFTTNRALNRKQLEDVGGWARRLGRNLPFSIVDVMDDERGGNRLTGIINARCNWGDDFARASCRADLESEARALLAESTARSAASTMGLEGVLATLARIDGPKTMLLFTSELPTDDARVEVSRVARKAASAQTRIHVMHSQNATFDAADGGSRGASIVPPATLAEQRRDREGLELVADWTGGDVFGLSGASPKVADRIVSEISATYLLLIETVPGDRDGQPHEIKVRVPGRSLTVRARREFVADNLRRMTSTTPAPRPAPAATPTPKPAGGEVPAPTARGSVFVSVDPLHPERKAKETIDTLNALRASLAARGYSSAPSAAEATVRVEVVGQRILGQGATALPTDSRSGSDAVAVIRVTVSDGDHIRELRGRNQGDIDIVKSAADETARLVEQWAGAVGAVEVPESVPSPPKDASTPPPQELLPRMRTYVGEYEQALAGIVAEERYQQVFSQRTAGYPAPVRLTRRELKSEIGFAWFPQPGTWFGFRDVLEVDGKAIPDRQSRLEQLFVERRFPSSEQLARVADASARFNIGPVRRNFNLPTMTLLVASPANAGRCSFELRGYDMIDGVRVAIVAFTETASPTLITREGHDWRSRGLLWLEPDSGRIRRTDLQLSDRDMEMRLTTWFGLDERLNLMVPVRMREMYDYPESLDAYVEATAEYSNVRRFRVQTTGEGDAR